MKYNPKLTMVQEEADLLAAEDAIRRAEAPGKHKADMMST